MSFLPRHRPAPLVDDDDEGGGSNGNGDGSVQLDSHALLLATAYLLAYLTLHTITGWASIATALPLTAALLYHCYRDNIPHSTPADIEREQTELSALMRAAVVYCSNRKKRVLQRERSLTNMAVDSLDRAEQKEKREDNSLHSPHLYLQLTSPNAHSHSIQLADDSTAVGYDRQTTSEDEDEEEKAAESSSVEQLEQQKVVTSPTRATATGAAALSVLPPKTSTTVLDATET